MCKKSEQYIKSVSKILQSKNIHELDVLNFGICL
jgi:hypothetical protein